MFDYMSGTMTMFHGFWMLIFWFILFYLFFLLFTKKSSSGKTPLEVLKKRLAHGEITQEEYNKLKKILEDE